MPLHAVEGYARECLEQLGQTLALEPTYYCASDEELRQHLVVAAASVLARYEAEGCETAFDFSFEKNSANAETMFSLLYRLKAELASHRFLDDDFGSEGHEQLALEYEVPVEAIEICIAYERHRQSYPVISSGAAALIRNYPQALMQLPAKSLYLIDEWHDINAAEFVLLQLLLRGERSVIAIRSSTLRAVPISAIPRMVLSWRFHRRSTCI